MCCDFLLTLHLIEVSHERSEDSGCSGSTEIHIVEVVGDLGQSALIPVHSLQNRQERCIRIHSQHIVELTERLAGDTGKGLRIGVHLLDHLLDDSGCSLGALVVLIHHGCHTEDVGCGDIDVRSDTGQLRREVHDISFIGSRGHTE